MEYQSCPDNAISMKVETHVSDLWVQELVAEAGRVGPRCKPLMRAIIAPCERSVVLELSPHGQQAFLVASAGNSSRLSIRIFCQSSSTNHSTMGSTSSSRLPLTVQPWRTSTTRAIASGFSAGHVRICSARGKITARVFSARRCREFEAQRPAKLSGWQQTTRNLNCFRCRCFGAPPLLASPPSAARVRRSSRCFYANFFS